MFYRSRTKQPEKHGLTFLCRNVGVRSALAIGLVCRFDFLDDGIDQFSHWTSWFGVFQTCDGISQCGSWWTVLKG